MKKKVLALVMAAAMTFGTIGMSTVAFAEGGEISTTAPTTVVPSKIDKKTVYVSNVEAGMEVTAYQIVKADYELDAAGNSKGFIGYKKAEDVELGNVLEPTAEEVAIIAANITSGALNPENHVTMNYENGKYKADLGPGYWVILVRNGADSTGLKMYNPMLAGVYYIVGGSDNTMADVDINGGEEWQLAGTDPYAKSADITFSKTLDGDHTVNLGDTVEYAIETKIPDYSDAYASATFNITDTMDGLDLNEGSIKVYVDGTLVDANDGTFTLDTSVTNPNLPTDFAISFDSDYVLEKTQKDVKVTYSAVVTDKTKVNDEEFSNDAKLVYSNAPYAGSTGTLTDTENAYTFDIDGDVTKDILKKVGVDEEKDALEGAKFQLYKNEACTDEYKNGVIPAAVMATSSDDGRLTFSGLDEGEYWLKETEAPKGYTLNPAVFKIVIEATLDETKNELKSWTVTVSEVGKDNTTKTNTFNVNNETGKATAAEGNETTVIQNTKLSTLPSTGGIGTTIFTIGGCAIMIAAAGIFFVSRKKEEEV